MVQPYLVLKTNPETEINYPVFSNQIIAVSENSLIQSIVFIKKPFANLMGVLTE